LAATALVPLEAKADLKKAAPLPSPPASEAKPGQEITIEAATLRVGSPTGKKDRNPAREADDIALALTTFAIDALPYPNDPREPPRAGAAQHEAAKLCAEAGKRLCSELEWELACKGRGAAEYPGQKPFAAAACAQGAALCQSDLGVFALGTLGREWTSSAARNGDWDRMRSAVVRGASKDAPDALHRCAARDAAAAESRSDSLLFRCCRGAAQQAQYPIEQELPAFRALDLEQDDAREKLRAMPETAALAASFRMHSPGSLLTALSLAGRSSQSLAPWQAATAAFSWSPVRGEELVVLNGDSQTGAALVAYYPSASGPRFAGSFVTKDEHSPILLAYKTDTRDELLYSTCWGCGGEGGALRLDASARLRFLPR
jgi:hypothetical protein